MSMRRKSNCKAKLKKGPECQNKRNEQDFTNFGTPQRLEHEFTEFFSIPSETISTIAALVIIAKHHPKTCVVLPGIPKNMMPGNISNKYLLWNSVEKKLYHGEKTKTAIQNCQHKKRVQMILGPILLFDKTKMISHMMGFILDTKWNEVEIFDPIGSFLVVSDKTNDIALSEPYSKLTRTMYQMSYFNSAIRDFFYSQLNVQAVYLPYEWCPLLGIQSLEKQEKKKHVKETPGYCMAWVIWWMYKRASYPNEDRYILLEREMKRLRKNTNLLTSYVRSYSKKIGALTKTLMIRSIMASGVSRHKATKTIEEFWIAAEPVISVLNELAKVRTESSRSRLNKKLESLLEKNLPIIMSISTKVYDNLETALQEIPDSKYVLMT